jgi:hypothetical protein
MLSKSLMFLDALDKSMKNTQNAPKKGERGHSFLGLQSKWVFFYLSSWHIQRLTGDILVTELYRGNASRVELGNIKWLVVFIANPTWSPA